MSSNGNDLSFSLNQNSTLMDTTQFVSPSPPKKNKKIKNLLDFYSGKSLESNKQNPLHSNRENDHLSQTNYLMSLVDRGPLKFLMQQMKTEEGKKTSNTTILWHKSHGVEVNYRPAIYSL